MENHHIIIGGTFDRLHLGHKKIIDVAFKKGKLVTIGIAERFLFKNKLLSQTIEDYQTRKKNIISYLKKNNWQTRVKFIPIINFYGTTLTDKTIDSIIVSKATKKNAQLINQARKKINFLELKIIVIEDVLAEDKKLITSERIRLGEIDQNGNNYWQFVIRNSQLKNNQLTLPENLREELRKPLGKVVKEIKKSTLQRSATSKRSMIISIGDIVSIKLMEVGINPDIKIIDFKTKREPIKDQKLLIKNGLKITVKNDPGTINVQSFQVIKQAIDNHFKGVQIQTIVVDGEEDLLTLPAILLAPLNSLVFYGQMYRGAVMVEVTKDIKENVKEIIKKFVEN